MRSERGTGKPNGANGRRSIALLVAVGLAGTVMAGCDAEAEDTPAEGPPPSAAGTAVPGITWGQCPPAAQGVERDPRLTCGTVEVPLDHRNPGGATIDVAV